MIRGAWFLDVLSLLDYMQRILWGARREWRNMMLVVASRQ